MARSYPAVHERVLSPLERRSVRPHRRTLLGRAQGRVLEIGGGTGEHLDLYSPDRVAWVTVVGPDAWTRPFLARRAADAHVPVEVLDAALEDAVPAGGADTIVVSFLLCSVRDPHRLLTTVARSLAEGGRFLFVEHVPGRFARGPLGDLASPAWRAATTGCDLRSDPIALVRDAGFSLTDLERFTMPTFQVPIRHCVAGVATVIGTPQ